MARGGGGGGAGVGVKKLPTQNVKAKATKLLADYSSDINSVWYVFLEGISCVLGIHILTV